jgi:hypothetical protein
MVIEAQRDEWAAEDAAEEKKEIKAEQKTVPAPDTAPPRKAATGVKWAPSAGKPQPVLKVQKPLTRSEFIVSLNAAPEPQTQRPTNIIDAHARSTREREKRE